MTSSNYRDNTSDPLASKLPSNKELAERMLSRQTVPKNAMVRKSEAGWELRGVWLDKLGGHFDKPELSEADFRFIGQAIASLKERVNLWVGDWLVASERVYGETYKETAEILGLARKTLYNYYYVCKNVDISLRRENLGYTHYSLVAAMDRDKQIYWIDRASVEDMTVDVMRDAIRADKPTTPPDFGDVVSADGKRRFTRIADDLWQGRVISTDDYKFLLKVVKLAKEQLG